MYSHGETFNYDIDGDDYELTVLETFFWEDKEYIISEDIDGDLHVLFVDEDEEKLNLVEDKTEFRSVIKYWREECLVDEDISDFDDDEYYDREDKDLEIDEEFHNEEFAEELDIEDDFI